MDGIGDYIYLIILAVAGLSSLLRKKKENTTSNSAPSTTKQSWEDVLRNLVPVEETKVEKPVIRQARKQAKVPVQEMSYETMEDTSSLRAKKQVSHITSSKELQPLKIETIQIDNNLAYIQLNSLEDAKRAFIYSEIFNRKY